jgi:hypothetical protein
MWRCKSIKKRDRQNFYIGYYCSLKETPSVFHFEIGCVVIVVVCTFSLSIKGGYSWNIRRSHIYIVSRKIHVTCVGLEGLKVPDSDERAVFTHCARVKETVDVRLLSRLHYDVCPLSPVAKGLYQHFVAVGEFDNRFS